MERRKNNPDSISVVVGAHNKDKRDESTQQWLYVKRIIMHPNYRKGGGLNADIALMELSKPLKFNERVVKSCMPKQGIYPATGKNCYIAGEFFERSTTVSTNTTIFNYSLYLNSLIYHWIFRTYSSFFSEVRSKKYPYKIY